MAFTCRCWDRAGLGVRRWLALNFFRRKNLCAARGAAGHQGMTAKARQGLSRILAGPALCWPAVDVLLHMKQPLDIYFSSFSLMGLFLLAFVPGYFLATLAAAGEQVPLSEPVTPTASVPKPSPFKA